MPDRDEEPKPDRSPVARAMTRGRKLLFGGLLVIVVLTIFEVALALLGVEPQIASFDPYVGFKSNTPLFTLVRDSQGLPTYRTHKNKLLYFNEQSFPAKKTAGTYRIFCMGGSTTHGRPYRDKTSFVGWLRMFLEAADPSKDWQVVNCGGDSYASYRITALMQELARYEPDLFVIYTGQNEFLENRTYSSIIEEHPVFTQAQKLLSRSRIASLIRTTLGGARLGGGIGERTYQLAGEVETIAGLDMYHRDDALRAQIVDHFRYNLGRMAAIGRAAGAEVIFVRPAANLKDFSPFKSEHREDLSPSERRRLETLRSIANEAMKDQGYAIAEERLREALGIDDRYALLHYELGRVLFSLGQWEAAAESFLRAVDEDVCPLRLLSEMDRVIQTVAVSQDVPLLDFRSYLKERCAEEYGHSILGREFFLDFCHPTIATHRILGRLLLDQLVERGVVDLVPDWNDARASEAVRKHEGSLNERDHAIARGVLAKVLRWADKTEESNRLIDSAASELAKDAQGCVLLGNRFESQGRLAEALEHYRNAIRLDPQLHDGYLSLAALLTNEQRFEQAAAVYEQLIAEDPDVAPAHTGLGWVWIHLKRFDDAEKQFQRVREIDPNDPSVRVGMGMVRMGQDRLDDALEEFQVALRKHPGSTEALAQIGFVHRRRGQRSMAIEYLNKAIATDTENAKIHFGLAEVLSEDGDIDAALNHFRRASELQPGMVDAHSELGELLSRHGDLASAVVHLEKVVELKPRSARAHFNLGLLHIRRRDYPEAVHVFRQSVEKWPNDARMNAILSLLLSTVPQPALRDPEAALRLAERACEVSASDDAHSLDALAVAYGTVDRFAEAVATGERALRAAEAANERELALHIQAHLDTLRRGQPVRLEAK